MAVSDAVKPEKTGILQKVIYGIAVAFPLYHFLCLTGILTSPPFALSRVTCGIGISVTGVCGDILIISATINIAFIMLGLFIQLSDGGEALSGA